eukprot:TRINITY_DN21916_c0_g1_i1.p2 TRINITY_DN21916_c0_g1~~TRINITY_DN21916_c0_g1_i1.p2  ORF type:complete len:114 (+),score=15.21 TRINITY_DN21916_c0_g1_i1:550-891(+)
MPPPLRMSSPTRCPLPGHQHKREPKPLPSVKYPPTAYILVILVWQASPCNFSTTPRQAMLESARLALERDGWTWEKIKRMDFCLMMQLLLGCTILVVVGTMMSMLYSVKYKTL